MGSFLKIALLLVPLMVFGQSAYCTGDDVDIARRASPAVVGLSCKVKSADQTVGRYFGTGAFIHEGGYIVTTTAVLPEGATDIQVFHPGTGRWEAKLIGADKDLELALAVVVQEVGKTGDGPEAEEVRNTGESPEPEGDPADEEGREAVEDPESVEDTAVKFPAIPLGDSSLLKLGESAYTIGNGNTLLIRFGRVGISAGVISAFVNVDYGSHKLATYRGDMIETTAAIYSSVDGGPLLDSGGNIVGLVSLNYTKMRRLGLSVPINAVREKVAEWLHAEGVDFDTLPVPYKRKGSKYTGVVEKLRESVVSLEVVREDAGQQVKMPGRAFIRRVGGLVTGLAVAPDEVLTSVWNVDGRIKSVHVLLDGGKRKVEAELVSWNHRLDLALLKLKSRELKPVAWGLRLPKVGTDVAVLGRSPEADQVTITTGIISGLNRLNRMDWMQVDAAVNFGNTGGVVANMKGEAIGFVNKLNSNSTMGQNSGVGFALGLDGIREELQSLRGGVKVGRMARPFFGISAHKQQPADGSGARVDNVFTYGAAHQLGIKKGDLIVELDGKKIDTWMVLLQHIRSKEVGDNVFVAWVHNGERKEGSAMLRQRPVR